MISQEENYFTVSQVNRHKIKIKRSIFIGSISPASNREAAVSFIKEIRHAFHDAAHNCYAYRIDPNDFRYSDDGEPSSTAGKPILAMLDKHFLLKSVLVITRYFGGTKLGVGGLIQAYGQSAEETIQSARLSPFIQHHILKIQYPYNFTRQLQYLVSKYNGIVKDSNFGALVSSTIALPGRQRKAFETEILSIENTQVQINEEKK